MKNILNILCFLPILILSQNSKWDYIGNIVFDDKTDKKDFSLCNGQHISQYFNDSKGFQHKGEKFVIEEFQKKYKIEDVKKENDRVRIRFVVNCNGDDRFRILKTNYSYKLTVIDKNTTSHLLNITRSLKDWIPKVIIGKKIDYYHSLENFEKQSKVYDLAENIYFRGKVSKIRNKDYLDLKTKALGNYDEEKIML
ncbi:MAG: hypothetical protein E2590_14545 [Chryseobacterium sp.]|nr:hypothetical protein [Chryseobacterium sp.]